MFRVTTVFMKILLSLVLGFLSVIFMEIIRLTRKSHKRKITIRFGTLRKGKKIFFGGMVTLCAKTYISPLYACQFWLQRNKSFMSKFLNTFRTRILVQFVQRKCEISMCAQRHQLKADRAPAP